MAPRTRRIIEEEMPEERIDIVDAAIEASDEETLKFDQIRDLFTDLRNTEGDSPLVITLMNKKNESSNWSFLKSMRPSLETFDIDKAMESVLEEHGAGYYKFVVRINGRARKHIDFHVGDQRPVTAPKVEINKDDSKEFMPVIFTMMKDQNAQALQSQERFMMMMQQMNQNDKATMLALMEKNKGPDFLAIIAACAPFIPTIIGMIKPKDSVSEIIGIIKSVKDLTGDSGSGEGDGMLGIAKTFAGPLMSALAAQQEQARLAQMTAPRAALPAPIPQAPQVIGSPQPASVDPDLHPILALIKDDILYYAAKNKDPQIVAETLAAELELQGLGYNDFVPLAQELMVSGDWLTELAKRGIDLRAHNAWAHSVLQELSNILAANSGNGEAQAGNGGNTTDTADNVATGEAGK